MAEFNCDVCGGKVVSLEREGWFLCENCGTEYPLEWMKAKFQKTQAVQIEGSVQVQGIANVENLYKRACLFLEDGKWPDANLYFDKILDVDAEYAPAYIGKICARFQKRKEELLSNNFIIQLDKFPNDYPEWQKAMRFADSVYRSTLEGYLEVINANCESQYKKAEKLFSEGKIEEAVILFKALGSYRDSANIYKKRTIEFVKGGARRRIPFGNYEWRILTIWDCKALMITENAIGSIRYNNNELKTSWEKCTLRTYLNNEFYNTFSAEDQAKIAEVVITNPNAAYGGTLGGNDTMDKIFLLSTIEANHYFKEKYALEAENNWWLRSHDIDPDNPCIVSSSGCIETASVDSFLGVRPALWLNLQSDIFKSGSFSANHDVCKGVESLPLQMPEKYLYLEQKRKAQEQSQRWILQGLCRVCGGKLSLFGRECKSCGRNN